MNLSLNIVMLVVILIVVVPFAWFIFAQKSAEAKQKKVFQKISKEHNVNLSVVEYWNNSCLGYDDHENTLIYINSSKSDKKIQRIELDDVRKCDINKISKDYKNGDKHYSEMSQLDLEFTFISNTQPVVITLYAVDDNFSQNRELERAEKWLAFIDKHKYNKNRVNAA